MRLLRVLALAVAVVVSACGGSVNPAAPSPTPVASAQGVNTTPAPAPTPTPTSPSSTPFTFVNVSMPASVPASGLPLWGLRGDNTAGAVKQMVFGDASGYDNTGLRPLYRIDQSVELSVSSEFAGKMGEIQSGVNSWQALTGFSMNLTNITTEEPQFSVEVGDSKGYKALTRRWVDASGRVIRANIVFRSLEDFSLRILMHELGHLFGLNHHAGVGALGMSGGAAYSAAELDNAEMMRRLPTGTPYPSEDASSLASSLSSGRARTETIICSSLF